MAFTLGFDLDQALYLLLVVGAGIGVALLAGMLARLGTAMASRTAGTLDDKLAKALRLPLSVFAGLVAAAVALVLLQGRLDGGVVTGARRTLTVLFVALAAWGLVRVLRAFLERAGERRVRFQPAARVGSRLVAVLVYTMGFLMVLSVFGLSIAPVLTGLGIAGLAVALALQDTGANFFAGIWIQTGRSMQPGHYVRLESDNKLEGYVEEVGWRVTRIRTLAGNTVVVPNNKLAQSVTTDFYLPNPTFTVSQSFRVGFEADPEQVIKILHDEAVEVTKALPGIVPGEPFAQLAEIKEDCNVYSVTVRVKEFVEQYAAQRELRMRVLRRFQLEKVRTPYPAQHVLQENVEAPKAKRKAEGPGGFAPGRRPPRPRAKAPPADPVVAEAAKAKREIEAQQREKEEKKEGGGGREATDGKVAAAAPAEPASDPKGPGQPEQPAPARAEGAATAKAGTAADADDGGEKPPSPLTRSG